MCTERRKVSLGFTRSLFPEGTHMCLIYDNEAHRRKIISQFLAGGMAAGEKVSYFSDEMSPEEVRGWLAEMNVELPDEDQDGHFEVSRAENIYCPDRKFVPDDMLDRLRAFYNQTLKAGFSGLRVSGEMSWALRDIPGSDRLMEYEALVNNVFATHPVTAVCQYDARRFDGATILNVHRVHPMLIVGTQVVRNPYYIRPEAFLKKDK